MFPVARGQGEKPTPRRRRNSAMTPDTIVNLGPLSWQGVLCALCAGAIIGFERQLLGKPVGIRTSMLVCMGTFVFVSVANSVSNPSTDPSRVIGQVITGVGFLGAGVMLARDGLVIGVTSAAAIWVLAAIGVTIASGYHLAGIKISILTVLILVGIDMIERTFKSLQKGVHARFQSRRSRSREHAG